VKALIKHTQAHLSRAERSGRPASVRTKKKLRRRIKQLRRRLECAPAHRLIVHFETGGASSESSAAPEAVDSGRFNHAGGPVSPSPAPGPPAAPEPPAGSESSTGSKPPTESESSPEPPVESEPAPEPPVETEPAPEPPVETEPANSESPAIEPAAALTVAVEGNRLVDGNGKTVLLHGVNLSGTMWSCLGGRAFASPTDDGALASMAAWHINAVRIPLNEDCWLGINGAPTDVGAYHAAIKNFVDRLHAFGMYAILDLHWNAPGTTLSHLGAGYEDFFEMADADHSPAFWESIASYFKDDHALLFDLYNEPFEISWACLREGCLVPRGYQTAGMQQLVDAVRSTGATQPVLIAGLNWASLAGEEWLRNRPEDPARQLAASIHAYGVMGGYNSNIGSVARQVPVVLTEVGEKDCTHEALDRLLPWADANGVSYLAWAWYTGNCYRGPALITDYSGTPTPYGIGYRDHLVNTFSAPSTVDTGL
jgi:endoglucanase